MTTRHLFFFLTAYVLLYIFLFPGYQFFLDPDATGYLSVAEKIARGNYFNSINGIWSPLGSWMVALFIKSDFNGIVSAKLLNGLYGAISLCLFFSLLKKMRINFFIEMAIMMGAVLLIIDFVFIRLFADLLQVLFLLLYLNIICSKGFYKNYRSIILAAFVGGIGFYAKAYTFYFILLHLPVTIILLEKIKTKKYFTLQSFKKIIVALTVLIFTILFWIVALNLKYGHFILGQKNVTGTLTEIYNPSKTLIYPPPADSYAVFDDITYFNFTEITPFTNLKLFVIQIKIVAFNFLNLLSTFNEFSFAFAIIILTGFIFILNKKIFFIQKKNNLLLFSFITIWPCGYLLFSIQSRFLWIMDLAVLLLAGILLSELIKINFLKRSYLYLFCFAIIGSFYIYPLVQLKNNFGSNKDLFEIAAALKKKNIKGRILTSIRSDDDYFKSISINYLIQSKFYGPYIRTYSNPEILAAIKKYQINYYIFFYSSLFQKETFLSGNLALNAKMIYKNIYPGVIVLYFNK